MPPPYYSYSCFSTSLCDSPLVAYAVRTLVGWDENPVTLSNCQMTTTRRVRHRARPQAEEGKGPSGGGQRVARGMGAPSAAQMEAMLARAAGAAREGAGGKRKREAASSAEDADSAPQKKRQLRRGA